MNLHHIADRSNLEPTGKQGEKDGRENRRGARAPVHDSARGVIGFLGQRRHSCSRGRRGGRRRRGIGEYRVVRRRWRYAQKLCRCEHGIPELIARI